MTPPDAAWMTARRESDLLRKLFESTVARCIAEGLVGGEGFAVGVFDGAARGAVRFVFTRRVDQSRAVVTDPLLIFRADAGDGVGYFDTPHGLLGFGFKNGKLSSVSFVFAPPHL